MSKLLSILFLTFLFLTSPSSLNSGTIVEKSIGSGIRLEDIHVDNYEISIFGINTNYKANFRKYNLQATALEDEEWESTQYFSNTVQRAMDVDGDKIVCVYVKTDKRTVVTKTSSDGGETWSTLKVQVNSPLNSI